MRFVVGLALLVVCAPAVAQEEDWAEQAKNEVQKTIQWLHDSARHAQAELNKRYDQILKTVYVVRTRSELRGMCKMLKLDLATGDPVPANFGKYLEANADSDEGDVTRDVWGTRFELVHLGAAISVRSCGPDKRCGSADDLPCAVAKDRSRR
jgi:hypothetical protein